MKRQKKLNRRERRELQQQIKLERLEQSISEWVNSNMTEDEMLDLLFKPSEEKATQLTRKCLSDILNNKQNTSKLNWDDELTVIFDVWGSKHLTDEQRNIYDVWVNECIENITPEQRVVDKLMLVKQPILFHYSVVNRLWDSLSLEQRQLYLSWFAQWFLDVYHVDISAACSDFLSKGFRNIVLEDNVESFERGVRLGYIS